MFDGRLAADAKLGFILIQFSRERTAHITLFILGIFEERYRSLAAHILGIAVIIWHRGSLCVAQQIPGLLAYRKRHIIIAVIVETHQGACALCGALHRE